MTFSACTGLRRRSDGADRPQIVVFPGVNHAFFNDTGPNHNANAAARAYDWALDWFGRFVDRGGQGG